MCRAPDPGELEPCTRLYPTPTHNHRRSCPAPAQIRWPAAPHRRPVHRKAGFWLAKSDAKQAAAAVRRLAEGRARARPSSAAEAGPAGAGRLGRAHHRCVRPGVQALGGELTAAPVAAANHGMRQPVFQGRRVPAPPPGPGGVLGGADRAPGAAGPRPRPGGAQPLCSGGGFRPQAVSPARRRASAGR